MRKCLLLALLLVPLDMAAQTTRTAASSALSDVQTTVNASANGDTVQIPCSPATSTWSGTLTVNANITITGMGATPNTGPSTFGAGSNCLTIIHSTPTLFQLNPVYNSTPSLNLTTVQNITFQPGAGAYNVIKAYCTATSSGQPNVRFDNLQFGNATAQYQYGLGSNTGEFLIIENNCFGVADHNTTQTGNQTVLVGINNSAYLGVGAFGDNSWAQPDTFGTANEFYVENNLWNTVQWPIIENEDFATEGGGRAVVRFNHGFIQGGFFFAGSSHGLDTSGRPRSNRTVEIYGNDLTCVNGSGGIGNYCYDLFSIRGGTGLIFGNTTHQTGAATWKEVGGISTTRSIGDSWAQWNYGGCGNATSGNAYGPFDLSDGVTYASGTFGGGTSGTHVVDSGSPGWSTNQWSAIGGTNYVYYVWDVTQGWISPATGNNANSIDVAQAPHGYINGGTLINASSGDSYQIRRSKGCLDGAGMGQSALITSGAGSVAVLASTGLPGPANPAFDPFYEWDDTMSSLTGGAQLEMLTGTLYKASYLAKDRNFFSDFSLGTPHVQTSPTSPFNGTTGVGFGTLANRPTTCTANPMGGSVPGVGYFAIDQGTWNGSGNGFGQGTLYECSATNTWTAYYGPNNGTGQPYTYPHPLAGGGTPQANVPTFSPSSGVPPQTVTMSLSTPGSVGCYTTDGSTPTAPTPGTCSGGTTQTYSSPISVSANPTTLKGIATAVGYINSGVASSTYGGPPPTCGDPTQLGPNYSGTYTSPPTTLPISIGFSSPTAGCGMHMTLDGTTPTCSSAAYAGQNISSTTTMRVIACQAGYTSSNIPGGTWTINAFFPLTVTATGGTITGTNGTTGSYLSGTTIGPLTANPNTGYVFTSGWSTTGSVSLCSGTGTCGPFPITTATTISATFTQVNYTVTTATAGTGSGTITCGAGPYHYNDLVSCNVTANAGSTITTVTGGGGTWTSSPYTFNMPAANTTVTATFKATAATPTFAPPAGSYITTQNVAISTTTPGSTILYTNNGSTPACPATGTTYTTPVAVSSSLTLKAIACATGYTDSAVASAAYTIANCTVSFSPVAGSYTGVQTVTISTSGCIAGTQVYYRTDGLPATNIDTQYTAPVVVSSSQTLTAKAVLSPTIRDQAQTISTGKKCNAVGSPVTFPSGYSCTNGSGGVAGTPSNFNFTSGTSNQMFVTTTDSTAFDTSVLLIDTPTATDNAITEMSFRKVYQDTTNCAQSSPNKYKCIDVSETDAESCCDTVTHALWQMSVRCSTNVSGSSGNSGFLEGDASSGSEKWDIPCTIGASTDITVNSHWTQHDTGCGGSGCMVLDSIYLNGTRYAFPASCDGSDTNCPNYPMTPQPTYGNFVAGSQDQVYARNVSVAVTSPLTTTRNVTFGRVGVDEGSEATGSAAYTISGGAAGVPSISVILIP